MEEPKEKDFTKIVIAYAELCGWYCYHVTNVHGRLRGQTSVGFPDLVLVKDKVLYRELKVGKNKLTKAQKAWGKRLQEAGQDWAVWRYDDHWDIELRGGSDYKLQKSHEASKIVRETEEGKIGPWSQTYEHQPVAQETSEGTRNSLQQHFRSGTGGMPEEA